MVKEARERYKITALQARKIYEILRLRATDISNAEEYKQYRLEVKRRLNRPFQKEKKSMVSGSHTRTYPAHTLHTHAAHTLHTRCIYTAHTLHTT